MTFYFCVFVLGASKQDLTKRISEILKQNQVSSVFLNLFACLYVMFFHSNFVTFSGAELTGLHMRVWCNFCRKPLKFFSRNATISARKRCLFSDGEKSEYASNLDMFEASAMLRP